MPVSPPAPSTSQAAKDQPTHGPERTLLPAAGQPAAVAGNNRQLNDQEYQLLTQLGVNLLALYRQRRYADADVIEQRLGFEHCSVAVAIANSQLLQNLPTAAV